MYRLPMAEVYTVVCDTFLMRTAGELGYAIITFWLGSFKLLCVKYYVAKIMSCNFHSGLGNIVRVQQLVGIRDQILVC